MPIYSPTGNLDITNATLRTSNIETQHIQISNVAISAAHNLQQVTSIGNATTNTIKFNNPTTSLTTASNVTVGNELTVSGNIISNQETTLTGNVTVGKNILLSSNTTTRVDSNVVVEHFGPHKRHPITPVLKKFPDVDFTQGKFDYNDSTRTYTQAGYVVSASSQSSGSEVWRLFDDGEWDQEAIDKYTSASSFQYNPTSNPNALGGVSGEWFKVEFPRKVIIDKFILNVGNTVNPGPKAFKVLGSDDDTSWTEIKDVSGLTTASYSTSAPYKTTVESVSSVAYRYYAVVITQLLAVARVSISEVEFYGYEENPPAGDSSIDTTFTSVMNTPQTGGVKVYVDGSTLENKITTGPTPTSTGATYDSTGKYWSITSNISVEANTFMSGDQPHAVSMWFNSSNLEANVSNTCVFSVSDQEKLDSQNLDLQSNTWHNLTYAYQGEGGSRVTYLDGRKVSEDQAEDTFGEYPPFAMTGYSQGGYVVSASSHHPNYLPWFAFDDQTAHATSDNIWISGTAINYDETTGVATSLADLTTVDGVQKRGEWIQMEFPNKICLSYIALAAQPGEEQYRAPKEGVIVGSNDGTTWETLYTFVNQTSWTANAFNNYVVNTNVGKGYRYVRIIIEKVQSGSSNSSRRYTAIADIRFYGHRENDLVRLPDPTRVLKYPHIAMTGPAQRGYVASSNNEYIPDGRLAWKAYDGIDTDGSTNIDAWMTNDPSWTTATPGEPIGTGDLAPDTFTVGGVNYTGHWNKLELPHKIQVSQIYMSSRMSTRLPYKGVFLGSDDDSSWEVIYSFNNTLTWSVVSGVGQATTITGITNTNSYKYVMLVVQQINGSDDRLWLNQIKYYGTGVDSIPIQIGGGNIDKVANFRVYDKFVEEDQALEIWDAQKDTFRGVKNSMTLHKGRLGIGTTEPEGRLAVLDEPHNLEEFPPRAMTGYKTYFEGHGEFCASASSEHSYGNFKAWDVFSSSTDYDSDIWVSGDSDWSSTDGTPVVLHYLSDNTPGGAWLKIEMPYKIKLNSFSFVTGTRSYSTECFPENFQIWASNNGTEWNQIYSVSGFGNPPNETGGTIWGHTNVNSQTHYSMYAMIITKLYMVGTETRTFASIPRWKLFGTREQGQSVLHDGQLTLTKNLDVPRIGPPPDADDTPRRDRLVVEYNTSTNPTFEGAVRDTSGRGNDGIMVGSSYSASSKALDLTNSHSTPSSAATSYITRTSLGNTESGNFHHSVSLWFKLSNAPDGAWRAIFEIGPHPRTNTKDIGLYVTSDSSNWLGFASGGSTLYGGGAPTGVVVGTYYHIVIVYDGAKKYIYQNGTLSNSGTYSSFNGARNMTLQIGRNNHPNANEGIGGSISNFKMYVGHALTLSEVKTLYDMGRCDEGQHVVNFSKTRVGIGLGDGEAPTSTLDVRGTFQGNSPLRFYVLEGVHPNSGSSQFVDLPPGCIGSRIVSITGMTFNTNGDGVPFERHSETAWEVDVYYSTYSSNPTYSNKFILSGRGTSTYTKPWKMFVVTT